MRMSFGMNNFSFLSCYSYYNITQNVWNDFFVYDVLLLKFNWVILKILQILYVEDSKLVL
jgi:hypothetical protein